MSLTTFLQNLKIKKGEKSFTHTSLGEPKGSYYIDAENQDEFYRLYTEAFEQKCPLYLTERHKDIGPILLDFDFRFQVPSDESQPTRRHTKEHIETILKIYFEELSKHVDVTGAKAYVMEKPGPRIEKEKVKDGLHIVIPSVVTKTATQHVVRKKTLSAMGKVFSDIGVTNSASDCFDEAVIETNNWLMYGSTKPDQPYYKVTYVYMCSVDGILEPQPINEDETFFIELFSIRNKVDITALTDYGEEVVTSWENERKDEQERHQRRILGAKAASMTTNTHFQYEYVVKLVEILDPARIDNYESWIRLGWCLRNIDHRLVDKWDNMSKRSPKYSPGECQNLWDKMRVDGGLGMGTLKMWAKQDNYEKYMELTRVDIRQLIYEAQSAAHYDVAKVIHAMFGSDYVCVSITTKRWYEFKKHRWEFCEDGFSLNRKISEEVGSEFRMEADNYRRQATDSADNADREKYNEIAKKLEKVAQVHLKNSSYKSNIMKECSILFYNSKFENTLNTKPNLIGFNNGVYDLDVLEFREGLPEDCISFSTKIDWIPLDVASKEYQDLQEFLQKVLTNPNIFKYVLLHLASCLDGRIREERFHLYTGGGSNGKSKTISLFEKAFGDYACKLPISLLTNKRSKSNEANSEIARTKGRRMACLQEPSENEHINVGLMKELSGGDTIQARSIYKEPEEFKPMFKMILICNHLPQVSADDDGTWRRIRIVEFTSKFTVTPNPSIPTEFFADPDLDTKIDAFKETFMAFLIEYYILYKQIGLKEPEEVMIATNEYKKSNDMITEFVDTSMIKESGCFAKVADVHGMFNVWFKENYPDGKVFSRKEFISVASKSMGHITNGRGGNRGWIDWKIVEDNDDDTT